VEITAGGFKANGLVTDQNTYTFDGVFLLRDSVSPKQLVPGLLMDGPHVKVERDLSTNVPGCFACGDIAGKPYQYIKSAGEGNVAALSAVYWLDEKRRAEG
jgi:thioredoxin reductase (NADPH)